MLASRTSAEIADGLAAHGIDPAAAASGGALPRISELPPAVHGIVEHAYGVGVGVGVAEIFLVAAPFGLLALLAAALLRERRSGRC